MMREYKKINTPAQLRWLQDEANCRRAAQAARIADREGQLWFESKMAEGQERLWPIAGIVASIWFTSPTNRAAGTYLGSPPIAVDATSWG
ncbi:hypothetical protein T492DRAFT_891282 [Pavlovales sp. CCMP2436]|nr:hypothetical protein T492DRAFT_891282 [Pavlovales sp. CCMP2436]